MLSSVKFSHAKMSDKKIWGEGEFLKAIHGKTVSVKKTITQVIFWNIIKKTYEHILFFLTIAKTSCR
jgi:hypothetical protein